MTINRGFFSYQTLKTAPLGKWSKTSPALLLIHDELVARGFQSMGRNGFVVRRIRGGTAWSTHAFGAAIDIRWPDRATADNVAEWLIEWSAELGIQRIHDYGANRYWQAGRGWLLRAPGEGDPRSFHLEVTPDGWDDDRPLADRGVPTVAAGAPTGPPKYPGKALKLGSTGANVKRVQAMVGVATDGRFGPVTEAAVRRWQTAHDLEADGIVGPITWRAMFTTNS